MEKCGDLVEKKFCYLKPFYVEDFFQLPWQFDIMTQYSVIYFLKWWKMNYIVMRFFSNSIKKEEFFYKLKFIKIENDDH